MEWLIESINPRKIAPVHTQALDWFEDRWADRVEQGEYGKPLMLDRGFCIMKAQRSRSSVARGRSRTCANFLNGSCASLLRAWGKPHRITFEPVWRPQLRVEPMEIFLPLPDAPVILNALAQSQRYETLEATHHLSQPILGAAFSPFSGLAVRQSRRHGIRASSRHLHRDGRSPWLRSTSVLELPSRLASVADPELPYDAHPSLTPARRSLQGS
jgi:hypothetical protein